MTPREAVHAPDLCPHCGAPSAPKMLVAHIQATVAAYYGIEVRYMKSAQRGKDIVRPRQVAMFLAAELTPKSLPDIGRCFSRDHTTIIHAIKAVRKRSEADAELAMDVGYLRARLSTGNSLIHSQKEPKSAFYTSQSDIEQDVNNQEERVAA
jgi:hypothetical protein